MPPPKVYITTSRAENPLSGDAPFGIVEDPGNRYEAKQAWQVVRCAGRICGWVVTTSKLMVVDESSSDVVVRDFIAAFIAAWPAGDAVTLGRFFSEDAEYHNGPVKPVKGRPAIVTSLADMMSLGGEVYAEIRLLLSDGPVVFTERVDYVRLGEKTAGLRIAGVFEVHGGVITAWRDYFDSNEFASQLSTS